MVSKTNQIRHPLPPRPISHHHHHQNKENQPIKPSKKPNLISSQSMNQPTSPSKEHRPSFKLPNKPTFHSKPINQPSIQDDQTHTNPSIKSNHQRTTKPIHTRTDSIRSSSSTSTLLSSTTREDAMIRRNLMSPTETNQQERVLAIVKVKQAVLEAKARKLPKLAHRSSNVYTPKPLLLPYKLARSASVNLNHSKRISLRSNLLNDQISSPSNLTGERPTHRRQLNSESIIFNHRRMFTESMTTTTNTSLSSPDQALPPRIYSPRSGSGHRNHQLSPDHRRSQYDSFYQLIGPESESLGTSFTHDHRFRAHSTDRRRDSTNSVLLSPVTIGSSSTSWNTQTDLDPVQLPKPTHSALRITTEAPIGNRDLSKETKLKKLRSCKSDGSICLKPSKVSLISLNNQPILSQRNLSYSQSISQNLSDLSTGKDGKDGNGKVTAIGKLKSILEENEDEVEFDLEKEIVDRLLKFKRLVWN
ncbi:uncharacterized protein MELLADRAFT_79711 [Melampsora larici-populina 98AG31]|uniref:Uncharacterized protein n=1 Tax=Melampsora larici-populina (strain 98AG31 / pathotype 3-4-7) TaxID=747676 RepID=F4SAG7_MELLP|nr:uncharacterized protein MELLADRAFT_79711 [Melampsora larici-populina 98AG31]EGF98323.1 hypothetical protein MELLADRAFT_79711 [Melampsora larici-populina 98AG31]